MSNAAQNDLRDKVKLEAKFSQRLTTYFAWVVSQFVEAGETRLPIDTRKFDSVLAKILFEHYLIVEKVFAHRIRNVLPREIQSTIEEDRLIARALGHLNSTRSVIVARGINKTVQKEIASSLDEASTFDSENQEVVDGFIVARKINPVGFEIRLVAARILKRKLKNKIGTIALTETQVPGEISKLTETEVLSGQQASIMGGSPRKVKVTKTWVSMGDSLVRDTHLDADGQTRNSKSPFTVGGQKLMVPGDSSLGATAKETINCRCAAVFNDKEVAAIRWDKLQEQPFMAVGRL